ncbi:MAG: RdgB/HAM1 family non-canonical purine NTP pyrophosphatase [bacterium]
MSVERLRLVLATRNRNKVLEIQAALAESAVQILSLEAFPEASEVVEDRETLEGNAGKKALIIHQHTGLAAMADDTGLFVEALDGAPGVRSSRYAGERVSYQENLNKLLFEMRSVPLEKRGARFVTVVALAQNGRVHLVRGECTGSIAFAPRGEGRFGYDPVFIVAGQNRTYAEMPLSEKNLISHRGRALAEFKKLLTQLGLV